MRREFLHVHAAATDMMASEPSAYRNVEDDEASLTVSSSILHV